MIHVFGKGASKSGILIAYNDVQGDFYITGSCHSPVRLDRGDGGPTCRECRQVYNDTNTALTDRYSYDFYIQNLRREIQQDITTRWVAGWMNIDPKNVAVKIEYAE